MHIRKRPWQPVRLSTELADHTLAGEADLEDLIMSAAADIEAEQRA